MKPMTRDEQLALYRAASGLDKPAELAHWLRSEADAIDDSVPPGEILKKKADKLAAERGIDWSLALSEAKRQDPELVKRVAEYMRENY